MAIPTSPPREVVSAAVPPPVAAEIRQRAQDDGRTVSDYLARLLVGLLENENGGTGRAKASTAQSPGTRRPSRDGA
jgi:hypothetical protein